MKPVRPTFRTVTASPEALRRALHAAVDAAPPEHLPHLAQLLLPAAEREGDAPEPPYEQLPEALRRSVDSDAFLEHLDASAADQEAGRVMSWEDAVARITASLT